MPQKCQTISDFSRTQTPLTFSLLMMMGGIYIAVNIAFIALFQTLHDAGLVVGHISVAGFFSYSCGEIHNMVQVRVLSFTI